MRQFARSLAMLAVVLLALGGPLAAAADAAGPEGQMTWAVPFALAPTYFEPAEASGLIAPFLMYYALHDALVKPMPGQAIAPGVAESWSATPDGLAFEFVLRKNVRFHNGDLLTAEDVKFSFERYRGVASRSFKTRVASVDVDSGSFAWGSDPDIDGLFQEQATETDKKRREAVLFKIQHAMHDRALFVPLLEPALLNGYGPRVSEAGLGLIAGLAYSAPYEDVRLKSGVK